MTVSVRMTVALQVEYYYYSSTRSTSSYSTLVVVLDYYSRVVWIKQVLWVVKR